MMKSWCERWWWCVDKRVETGLCAWHKQQAEGCTLSVAQWAAFVMDRIESIGDKVQLLVHGSSWLT